MVEKTIPFGIWIVAAITLVAMGWLFTRGPFFALAGFMVGKHVLIALLAGGLGVDSTSNIHKHQV